MELIDILKDRARKFTDDNYRNPTPMDYLVIESAMMVGVSIHQEEEAAGFLQESYCLDSMDEAREMFANSVRQREKVG